MKKILSFCLIVLCVACGDSSVEQLQEIQKPATVFAKKKGEHFNSVNTLIIRDMNGNLIELKDDHLLEALVDKYNVGDTIN